MWAAAGPGARPGWGTRPMERISAETVRQLAAAAGIRPDEQSLAGLARALEATISAVEACDALDLSQHQPASVFRLSGGASDAEL